MDEIVELGTDLSSKWQFKDGDLILVDNKENLIQSILNRLNCDYDGLDLFYYEYGSVISSFLGWKKSDETLEFIRLEIESTLEQEPRLTDFQVEVYYNKIGKVIINLLISFDEDSDFTLSLVLEKDGEIVADGE